MAQAVLTCGEITPIIMSSCPSPPPQLYVGYCDDPRNTDNAWMETVAMNFHDESGTYVCCHYNNIYILQAWFPYVNAVHILYIVRMQAQRSASYSWRPATMRGRSPG